MMSIATEIISGQMPHFESYIQQGVSLDDLDEYGFTPLIECAIARQLEIAKALVKAKVEIDKPDITGRTALHWAVYQDDFELTQFLLEQGANPNAYTNDGLAILVYPVLRRQDTVKHLLYQFGAKLDFALDFIHAKLLGHRYSLQGSLDVLNAKGGFIEVNYEGFILEFTVALVKDALYRFVSSFSTRHLREHFTYLYPVMDAFDTAAALLQLQNIRHLTEAHHAYLSQVLQEPMLILPAASRGHAIGFVRYKEWWAKIDRGEHAQKEGSVNIYKIRHPEALTVSFLEAFLFQRQPRKFFHEAINQILGLEPVAKLPIEPQTVGNCSWANIQALIPAAYFMQQLEQSESSSTSDAMFLYETWVTWDQDRALEEALHRFYHANALRKASIAGMLAAVLFQACDASIPHDLERAEKILTVVGLAEYAYILNSYLEVYCVERLTERGNNLLKILDDCGINPNIGVAPVATPLKVKKKS